MSAPRGDADQEAGAAEHQDGGAGQPRGTILVVDDTPAYRRLLGRLLTQAGYAVQVAAGGAEALARLATESIDLILLDVRMPEMDGYQVCAELRTAPRTRDIPVIFVSGADDLPDKMRAFACGGVDYIAKPFQEAEVLARVATHLALRGLRKDLESRVQERTAALAAANARLSAEIAERREAEEKFRGVLESAPEAMVIVDQGRRIALVNSQAEALFGYPRAELIGQPVEVLMPERFRDGHGQAATAYLARPRVRPVGQGGPLLARRRDGSEFPAEISLSPLDLGDRLLVVSTIRDVTARQALEEELVSSRQRLREWAAHRETVREEERKRIAGEIHDELGSLLTALKMDISLLRMGVGDDPAIQGRIGQMRDLVEQTIRMVRRVATQLRPAALNLGIVPALEWLLEDFGRRTAIACRLAAEGELEMDDAQATALFRIVQESLTNVARHAGASEVTVSLAQRSGTIDLQVRDNGCGFDPRGPRDTTFGLLGLHERATLLGGRLAIDSGIGRGTTVALVIPGPEACP